MTGADWMATFIRPGRRGGLGREISRRFVAPDLDSAFEWARVQANTAGWVLVHVEHMPGANGGAAWGLLLVAAGVLVGVVVAVLWVAS